MKTFVKFIICAAVLAFLCGIIGVVYKYTNGFNEDFKTFYIEYNGEQILTTENKMEFKTWEIHKFGVKYTFDKDEAEPRDYSIKILPNMTKDFDYTVDGERYLFSKITDLTKAFEIDKGDSSFMLCLPNVFTLKTALENYHDGKNVVIPTNAESENEYPFKMVVSSYNNSITYNILFKVVNTDGTNEHTGGGSAATADGKVYRISVIKSGDGTNLTAATLICPNQAKSGETVNFEIQNIEYGYELTGVRVSPLGAGKVELLNNNGVYSFVMPNTNVDIIIELSYNLDGDYYFIECDTLGNGSLGQMNLSCPAMAKAGDKITFTVSLYDFSDEPDYKPLEITAIRLNDFDGEEIEYLGNGEGAFSFIMPAANVTIMFYLMYA